jgi:iron(III) transport system ATP-binding protein
MSHETVLDIRSVGKRFGDTPAVADLSLSVAEGEILALLGASGCGKTTTLRMVAGLEDPSEGEIIYDGRVIASAIDNTFVPPNKRNMGIVFQSYALWPHMTVFENVAHPLKVRKRPKDEVRERVASILETVGMAGFEERPIPELSGGQQQRVALARAVVYEPRMLLLDEPFSNLDAQLRGQMRLELRNIQRRLGMTTLFVTHDQGEALSFADRIAVMHEGRLAQVGTPEEVYRSPTTKVVRDFLGRVISSSGTVISADNGGAVIDMERFGGHQLHVNAVPHDVSGGDNVEISIRPEDILLRTPGDSDDSLNKLRAEIRTLLFVGDHWECQVQVGDQLLLLHLPHTDAWQEGQHIDLVFPPDSLSVWAVS